MKKTISCVSIVLACLLLTITSCRKQKTLENKDCGCGKEIADFNFPETTGILNFYQYKNQWILSTRVTGGFVNNAIPCNANFPALKQILKNAKKDENINVIYSGKAKVTCPGEDFGITTGSTAFYYIELEKIAVN